MSKAHLGQFHQEVIRNSSLQQKLEQAKDDESLIAIVLELGKEKGHSFSRQEIEKYINEIKASQGEISDDELEAIAGGTTRNLGPWKGTEITLPGKGK